LDFLARLVVDVSKNAIRATGVLFLVAFAAPCARAQSVAPSGAPNIAFVADGAGNYQMASRTLRATALECHAPLAVETFIWSHGYLRIVTDQVDLSYARQEGKILAETVLAYKKSHPDTKVHLLGHSAGALVVLAAAEWLPPESIQTMVLLSPSVSSSYDLRPALRCVQHSVEVHYSEQDWVYLGIWTGLLGCGDRRSCEASGRFGFKLEVDAPADAALASRLVQYPWQHSYTALGNLGGHYGAYQPAYLKLLVLPALAGEGR
jgi:pimeloyl-ACP methyl ester carboxylesterase